MQGSAYNLQVPATPFAAGIRHSDQQLQSGLLRYGQPLRPNANIWTYNLQRVGCPFCSLKQTSCACQGSVFGWYMEGCCLSLQKWSLDHRCEAYMPFWLEHQYCHTNSNVSVAGWWCSCPIVRLLGLSPASYSVHTPPIGLMGIVVAKPYAALTTDPRP